MVVVVIAGPLLLPGVIAAVPVAALAGVIVYAALTLLQPREWILLARFRLSEVAIAAACAVSVVFFGILPGVLIAIALSITEFIARTTTTPPPQSPDFWSSATTHPCSS